jgi:hypothetical protein
MGERELTVINEPFVDENFQELQRNNVFVKNFIKKISDETIVHDVIIEVTGVEMIPTVMFFSLKKRSNVRFTAKLWEFDGVNFVHSFLKNSHINKVIKNE